MVVVEQIKAVKEIPCTAVSGQYQWYLESKAQLPKLQGCKNIDGTKNFFFFKERVLEEEY